MSMTVELSKILVEIISYYKWNQVFYIYNHENAVNTIESIIKSKIQTEILVRKIKNINHVTDVLRLNSCFVKKLRE